MGFCIRVFFSSLHIENAHLRVRGKWSISMHVFCLFYRCDFHGSTQIALYVLHWNIEKKMEREKKNNNVNSSWLWSLVKLICLNLQKKKYVSIHNDDDDDNNDDSRNNGIRRRVAQKRCVYTEFYYELLNREKSTHTQHQRKRSHVSCRTGHRLNGERERESARDTVGFEWMSEPNDRLVHNGACVCVCVYDR